MKKRILTLATTLVTSLVMIATMAAQPAQAADNDRLTASRTGADGSLIVDWTGPNSFVLRNARLRDTACDSQPVFFFVQVPAFRFRNHFNHSGCGSLATFGTLPGSTRWNIPSLRLYVCVDTLVSQCAHSRLSRNPYY